jgi:hypothetical protein
MKNLAKNSPVVGNGVSDYLNREDVRNALHIPASVQTWNQCSGDPFFLYTPQTEASFWIYPILRNKYRLMFLSGDTDGAIPTHGTRQWIKKLGWPVTEAHRPWFTDN